MKHNSRQATSFHIMILIGPASLEIYPKREIFMTLSHLIAYLIYNIPLFGVRAYVELLLH